MRREADGTPKEKRKRSTSLVGAGRCWRVALRIENDARWQGCLGPVRSQFGHTVCGSCDPDNPAKFLRQIADELDGKLSYYTLDSKIHTAWWSAFIEVFASAYKGPWPYPLAEVKRAFKNGPHPTYAQWKVKFKALWGTARLPGDFVLQRSIKRLGLHLCLTRNGYTEIGLKVCSRKVWCP